VSLLSLNIFTASEKFKVLLPVSRGDFRELERFCFPKSFIAAELGF
jgi:hypothetical protein